MSDTKQDSEMEFEDAEHFKGTQDTLGFKQIVLKQYMKCCIEGSKEMSGGGLFNRIIDGQLIEMAVPNQREIFINSIQMLHKLIIPLMIKHEKVVKPHMVEFNKQIKELNGEMTKNPPIKYDRNTPVYKKNPQGCRQIENASIKQLQDRYELRKVEIYREYLFKGISFLLSHVNYFEEESFKA